MIKLLQNLIKNMWSFIADHWNTLLAGGSIAGLLVAELWPPAKAYQDYFLFLCINAIVWTLVAVKVSLDKLVDRETTVSDRQFPTLRSARRLILEKLKEKARSNDREEVIIFGGRIRSIIEILREFRDDCENNPDRQRSGLTIRLFAMSPDFVGGLKLPGKLTYEQQSERNELTSGYVKASLAELGSLASDTALRQMNVDLVVETYDELPFGYFFMFGSDSLVFGGYVCDEAKSDIVGPASPCWHVESRSENYEPMKRWLDSRVAMIASANRDREESSSSEEAIQVATT